MISIWAYLGPESVHLAKLHQEFTIGQSHTERLGPLLGCQHYAVKLLTLKINSVQQEYSPGRSGFGKHFRIWSERQNLPWQAGRFTYLNMCLLAANRPWLPKGQPGSHRLTWTKVSNISQAAKKKGLAVISSPVHLTIARYPRQHSKVTVTELRCTLPQCEYFLEVGHKRKLMDKIIRFNCITECVIRFNCIFGEIQNVLQTMLRECLCNK